MIMRRKWIASLAVLAALFVSAVPVAAGIEAINYAPLKKAENLYAVTNAAAFANDGGTRIDVNDEEAIQKYYRTIDSNTPGALVPPDVQYQQQIEAVAESTSQVVSGRVVTNESFIPNNLNDYGPELLDRWKQQMYFFNLTLAANQGTNAIQVRYNNYRLFVRDEDNPAKGRYLPVDVVYTVTEWSEPTRNVHQAGQGKPIVGIGRVFYGLPCILMGNVANLQVKFTVYEAGTDTTVPDAKMSFTYGDIDKGQAVSVRQTDLTGLVCLSTSELQIASGYNGYTAVNGDASLTAHEDIPKDSMGFFGDTDSAGTMELIYTSNQYNYSTGQAGFPSGAHSWFSVATFNAPADAPPLDPPAKKVYDDVPDDDVIGPSDTDYGTHNTIQDKGTASGCAFRYEITQEIPAGYEYAADGSGIMLGTLKVTDVLPQYVTLDRYEAEILETGAAITQYFSRSGSDYICSLSPAVQRLLYNNKQGSTLKLTLHVHVEEDATSAQLKEKYGPAFTWQGRTCVDIPNTASTTFAPVTGMERIQDTGTVHTRIGVPAFHSLTVQKEVNGTASDPEDTFTFLVEFTGLVQQNGVYPGFRGLVTDGDGNTVRTIRAPLLGEDHYTQQVKLKGGQKVQFPGIPGGTSFQITEKRSDYAGSYTKIVTGGETGIQTASGSGAANQDLMAGPETTGTDRDLQYTYRFRNTRSLPVLTNSLAVSKIVSGGSGSFDFNASFLGLAENGVYAVVIPDVGDTVYRVQKQGDELYLEDGDHERVPGILFSVTRGDGEQRSLMADEDGTADFSEIRPWVLQAGSAFSVSWAGNRDGEVVRGGETKTPEAHTIPEPVRAGSGASLVSGPVFNQALRSIANVSRIQAVLFCTGEVPEGENAPVDEAGTGAITASFDPNTNTVFIISSGPITAGTSDMSGMFKGFRSLREVGISGLDTSGVTTMESMFEGCAALTTLTLDGFDTSGVTDLDRMFYGVSRMADLDLSSFDLSSLTSADGMLQGMSNLETLITPQNAGDISIALPKIMYDRADDNMDYAELPPVTKTLHATADYGDDAQEAVSWSGAEMTGTVIPFMADEYGAGEVSFSLAHDRTAYVEGLPQGADYTVTEAANGYQPSVEIQRTDGEGTVTALQEETAGNVQEPLQTQPQVFGEGPQQDEVTFRNRSPLHDLKVTKQVEPASGERFEFRIDLSGLRLDAYEAIAPGEDGEPERFAVIPENGQAHVSALLGHGQSLQVLGLEEGAHYRISEEGKTQYAPSYEVTAGTEGAQSAEGNADAGSGLATPEETVSCSREYVFTNTKDPEPEGAELTVTKRVTGEDLTEAQRQQAFTIEAAFTGLAPNTSFTVLRTEGGSAAEDVMTSDEAGAAAYTMTVRDGTGYVFRALTVGCEYQLSESPAEGVTGSITFAGGAGPGITGELSRGVSTGRVVLSGDVDVDFVNEVQKPELPHLPLMGGKGLGIPLGIPGILLVSVLVMRFRRRIMNSE